MTIWSVLTCTLNSTNSPPICSFGNPTPMTLNRPDFAAGTGALSVTTSFPRVSARSPSHPDKSAGSVNSTPRTIVNSDLSFTDNLRPASSNNRTDWNCGDQFPSAFMRPAVIQEVSEAFATDRKNTAPPRDRLAFNIGNKFIDTNFTVICNSIKSVICTALSSSWKY